MVARGRRLAIMTCVAVMFALPLSAQRGGGARGAGPRAARDAAAIDLTGYWVSVVTEDWKWRMVTPKKGVFDGIPLNAEGRQVGEAWDPAKDEAAGEQCRAYGAAGLMRLPTRLHITWQDANTLKVETDYGTQTRIFHFGTAPAPGEASWQGLSVAQWQSAGGARGAALPGGDLKVTTTNLRPGYVRKNGAPYSDKATVTEYFDVDMTPNGDQWLTVTTRVEDPQYFRGPYITTSDFKKLPDAKAWNPTPCSAR
ncbi:MAG TPA: hypothetical protein VL173_18060 [Vicinamibacterales bacterium]|nr:hypothetical protein [Vicinamibacterales bacterium]